MSNHLIKGEGMMNFCAMKNHIYAAPGVVNVTI